MRNMTQLLMPLAFVAALGLLAAGCPCKHAHVHHGGHKAKPCGRGKAPCKRGYYGRKGGCEGKSKCGRRGARKYKMMRKIKRMGAPKLLCGKKLKRHAKMLGLTADQVTKIDAIVKAAKAGKTDTELKVKQTAVALEAEWLKDAPDAAKIKQLATTLLSVVENRIKTKMMAKIKVQKVLTAKQWMKIRLMSGHHRRWRGKRGWHGKKRGCTGCVGGCEGCKGRKGKHIGKKKCGCKGPCTGKCKRKYHGRKYSHRYGRRGCGKGCMMKSSCAWALPGRCAPTSSSGVASA